jgi:NitT/TauT family transport system permease protein
MQAASETRGGVTAAAGRKRSLAAVPGSARVISLISILVLLLGWQFVASVFYTPIFMPTPLLVLQDGIRKLEDGTLFVHVGQSLLRILSGFIIGSLLGAPIGLLMGTFWPVRAFLYPHLQFFRSVPPIAWLTPAVLWFGIGEESKIVIITYTTVFIVILNTMVGVLRVSPNKIRAARSLGATERQVFVHVIVPATLPYILTGMQLAMGLSFATVVSAEMIAAERGVGFLIYNSRLWGASDTIFLGIVLLGVMGITVDRLFRAGIRRFAHQYGPTT